MTQHGMRSGNDRHWPESFLGRGRPIKTILCYSLSIRKPRMMPMRISRKSDMREISEICL
jgi:hypothetical protein